MTLQEIWANRGDMRYVAFRTGTVKYISLAHKSAEKAFDSAESKQGLALDDLLASDWVIGEISEVDGNGQVIAITAL